MTEAASDNPKPKPPTASENLKKASETLRNVGETFRYQIYNNLEQFANVLNQKLRGNKEMEPELEAVRTSLVELLNNLLKSPIKRQVGRIDSVSLALAQVASKIKENG